MGTKFMNFIQHPLVLFFLAWLVSYLFYRRQKHYRRISYQSQDAIVIDPKASQGEDGLEVRYAGEVVPQVTRSTVRFWNSGTEAIRGSDISTVDPLRWQAPEGAQILSLAVRKVTRDPIAVTISQQEDQVLIKFEFLEPDDGALFSVLHTGASSTSKLKGTVIGLKDNIVCWGDSSADELRARGSRKTPVSKWAPGIVFFVVGSFTFFGVLALASGIYPNFFLDHFPDWFNRDASWTDLSRDSFNLSRIFFGLFISIFFGAISMLIVQEWRNRPPVGLRGSVADNDERS